MIGLAIVVILLQQVHIDLAQQCPKAFFIHDRVVLKRGANHVANGLAPFDRQQEAIDQMASGSNVGHRSDGRQVDDDIIKMVARRLQERVHLV